MDNTLSRKLHQLLADNDRPEAVRLPKSSWLPFSRNQAFAIREEIMQSVISQMLYKDGENGPTGDQPIALVGPDGSGKTQLALEICYRCGQFYDGVHWIDARRNMHLAAEIAVNGQVMNLPNWLAMIPEQAESILKQWQGTRRLVVMDQVEEPELLSEWLNQMGSVQVLITSTTDRWLKESGCLVYTMEGMERKESISLLRKSAPRLRKEKDSDLEQLSALLCDFPLALSLAGNHLKSYPKMSVSGYVAELEKAMAGPEERVSLWIKNHPEKYTASLGAVFMHSLGHLGTKNNSDPMAKNILGAASYCAPDVPIPLDILRNALKVSENEKTGFERSISSLYHLGMLTQTNEGPVIHILTADLVRSIENTGLGSITGLAESLAASSQGYERKPLRDSLIVRAHMEAAAPFVESAAPKFAGAVWNGLGYEYWMMGNHSRARTCYEKAITLDQKAYGLEDYRIATEYYNLGRVLVDTRDLAAAKECFLRSAAISPDYKVATEFYNLGNMLIDQRERKEAKDCFERATAIIEKIYGPEYPLYATYSNRLGQLLFDLDEYEAAKACFERVLAIHEKAYSSRPNHTQLAIDASNLGHVLKRMGDLQGSKAYFERALAINENPLNYGRDHLQVAKDANNLGRVLRALGDLQGARACFERVLKINERSRGLDLSDVTKALINMGLTLRELGEQNEAKAYFEKALAIDQIVYSTTDSSVATDVHRLGVALRSMGDLPRAMACFERAVELEERVHGPDHVNVATNLHHLGRVAHEMKDLPTAKMCYERALAIDKKKYGHQHSYVATDINDLGSLLQDMKDLVGAKACFEQALAIDEKVHGPEHPNVARDMNNLGSVQKALGDLPAAKKSFSQAAEIFEMFYGADHPKTKIVRQNLENIKRKMAQKK